MELWRRRTLNRTLCVFILYLSGLQCVCSSGRCSLFSRQHIHTFDGMIYEFPGDCSYMLAGDCQHRSFSVLGDFSQGKRKGVTLFLGEFFELQLSVDGTLSQGDERIPLPYASGSVFADVELSNIRLWSEDFGFSIRIDPSHNIQLVLDKHHSNQTCGLCGNYNYLREDEFITQEGLLTDDPYDFANSWTLKAADEACGRVSPPSQTCNISGETAQDLMSRCEALSTSALFLRCSHLVDVTAFVSVCEADMCHCGGAECACQAMLEYARSCATLGLKLHDWHLQNQCTLRCPLGLEYSDCSSGCSTSCQTVGLQDVCREECVDGCRCPLGKVLDGDRCVEVSQCSCSHAGRLFASGSSVSQDCNTCVCRHASWECTNEVCPGECLVMGQSHFKSFDGKFFTFSGICQYLLAKDCLSSIFSVFIETAQCAEDEDAVCTHSVVLIIQDLANQTLHLKHGGVVSLDGLDIQTPLINGALRVQKTVMSSVRLRYGEDLLLDWDGKGRVLLRLSPAFAGKTCGLCGNYNGNQGDDFRTVGGLVETRVEGFGNAWKMNADCESVNQQHSDPCILNPKRVRFAEESCVVLLSLKFQPCHDEVNPGPYVKNCRYDVCSCADGQECLCDAVSSYAAACASRGVLISWRTRDYCEMDCSGGQAYEACGSVCNRTCRSLSLPDTECDAVCDEGCFCPSGLFLSDSGECLPPDRCPCHHKGEIYQPHHVTGDHHAICVCENGSMRCSSNEVSGWSLSDHFSPSRERRSVSCPPPLQLVQCVGVRDSGVECARTCQNLELECVSQGCLSGCMCPAGTVRHRKQCISPAQCPCYHNNRPYASGQSVDVDCNRCVCEERQWKCTERVCDGVCRVIGDTHFIGFDGLKFSFPGRCQYVLAQDHCAGLDGSFRVLLESSGCGLPVHHCTKSITVLYMGGTIVMEHGEVRMQKPVPIDAELEIIRSGLYYVVLLGKDISITWDTGTRVSLKISARYRGKVCGLCGNFDANQNNDILSSRNQLEIDPFDFGNSWKVRANCADAVVEPSQCSTDLLKLISVEQSCRVLTSAPFRTCNTVVDPEPYWEICTHDTCLCASLGDCACFCNAVAAYAHECAQKGLPVIWRSNDLCPLSCEERNRAGGVDCEWRYNACGSACPVTCQRPEALYCPVMCVEGCQAVCPPGKILDEVLMKCVEPAQCQVCVHDGERVSHGKLFVLNHEDPHRCQICHCENSTVTCRQCPVTGLTSTQTPPSATTPAPLLPTTPSEQACDRAMDLAFLLDGSSALSEEDFHSVKLFILRVVERFRMGSAHTRATVLLFHSGVKSFDMQVQKWMFKKTVRELHYSGGDAAFMDEAIKYLAVYIYDKDKREHAGRVAILLTASANPRPMRSTQRLLRKKDITVLTVVLGPDVDMTQVNDITKATPSSRAYVLNSVSELEDEALVISDYLCTLGLDPEIPKKPTTMPNTDTSTPFRTAPPTAAVITPSPSMPSSDTTFPPSTVTMSEMIFLLESSDEMGEEKFNQTRDALVDVLASLDRDESDRLRVTVIQYSITITVVISRMELRRKEQVLQKMQKMRWKRGVAVNTGQAVLSVYDSITPTADRTLFLITQNPSSDVIQPLPSSAHITLYPIGIGNRIKYQDLARLGFPQPPIILDTPSDLRKIRPLLINISLTINKPFLPPRPTLPPSVPCSKPIDVLFLLPALPGSQFEVLKTFVRTFIKDSNIGRNGTQVAVMVYGAASVMSVSWRDEQSQNSLIKLLENIPVQTHDTQTELGAALRLAVQTAVSSTSGGRMGVSKSVVVLQTNKSKDSVLEAANEALTAGVSVFPVGLGRQYDESDLKTLAGPQIQNILQLQGLEDLLDSALMGQSFPDKLCRAGPPGVCVDDEGNEREPGETWILLDGCHSLLCNPSGAVTVQSHRINCEKMEPPTCRNKLPALRLNNTCGCSWTCPCSCSGSSTSHVVSFTGAVLKLRAACSYLLLRSEGAELVLHTAACQSSANQVCMKSVEMKVGETRVEMHDDMKVMLDGAVTLVPVRIGSVSVNLIGAIVHRLRSELHGFTLSFTPHSNQFTIDMDLGVKTNTTGLCGSCSDDSAPQLVTSDLWTLDECVQQKVESCASVSPQACDVLTSDVFGLCHALVAPQDYVQMCNSVACRPDAVCELLAAYSSMCRQQGVCVDWRTSSLCPMSCSDSREYEACRTGCVEQCGQSLSSSGDASDGPVCLITPTEGCFCPNGTVMMGEKCVERDDCNQCVDQHGHTHQFLESWNPEENPCVICVCLDQQKINCTAVSCSKSRAPECGLCEIVREKTGSKCCPEYECVCDPDCQLSDPPQCDDGLSLSLTNPGQCRPFYQCVCRKDLCPLKTQRSCPEHKRLSVRASACCDVYECVCDCENATRTCPPGYITKVFANDCGCTEVSCTADQVCVVDTVVQRVGSVWEETCRSCSCTAQTDAQTGLHIAQCVDTVCNQICPLGSTYTESEGECCGRCRMSSCVEDTRVRPVGEQWTSPHDPCVRSECVQVNQEVFIQHTNVSCHIETPSCPLGTELQCNAADHCCPSCHCAPMDVCMVNQTVIAAGERVMLDVCTSCECVRDKRSYRLSCRRMSCSPCSEGYALESIPGACCGHCVATACSVRRPDGQMVTLKANTTQTDGCSRHTCVVNQRNQLLLETLLTSCPPLDRRRCLESGGQIRQMGDSCCEMCAEPECRRSVKLLDHIRVGECESEEKVEVTFCEGKCSSKSVYSVDKHELESVCSCCSAAGTVPVTVSLRCPNATHLTHQLLAATGCVCTSFACPAH